MGTHISTGISSVTGTSNSARLPAAIGTSAEAPGDVSSEIGRLLAHLEHKLSELDQLQQAIVEDAHALAHAVNTHSRSGRPRTVFSIRDAARELGVSVSMLHKLLKDRRLGHLKVGARTLITAEHLAAFRRASEVGSADPGAQRGATRSHLDTVALAGGS